MLFSHKTVKAGFPSLSILSPSVPFLRSNPISQVSIALIFPTSTHQPTYPPLPASPPPTLSLPALHHPVSHPSLLRLPAFHHPHLPHPHCPSILTLYTLTSPPSTLHPQASPPSTTPNFLTLHHPSIATLYPLISLSSTPHSLPIFNSSLPPLHHLLTSLPSTTPSFSTLHLSLPRHPLPFNFPTLPLKLPHFLPPASPSLTP